MTDDDTTHDSDASPDDDPQEDADSGFDFDGDGSDAGSPDGATDDAPEATDDTPEATDGAPEATDGEYTLDGDSTDPPRTAAGAPRAAPARDGRRRDPPRDGRGSDPEDKIRTYVLWAALGVLGLFSVVLLFQFYGSAMQAITDWVGPEYRSVVRSAVSLVLLCLTLVGVVQITRELTE
ncbi:hypothetical protein [Haloarchaeobius baliensis]|uniref:hypothetical protein n=1 Tax=Haloarchaeobius baliensis TaxID=1670458 RepID=UPI003F88231B